MAYRRKPRRRGAFLGIAISPRRPSLALQSGHHVISNGCGAIRAQRGGDCAAHSIYHHRADWAQLRRFTNAMAGSGKNLFYRRGRKSSGFLRNGFTAEMPDNIFGGICGGQRISHGAARRGMRFSRRNHVLYVRPRRVRAMWRAALCTEGTVGREITRKYISAWERPMESAWGFMSPSEIPSCAYARRGRFCYSYFSCLQLTNVYAQIFSFPFFL
jgi:hypothetical protein